MLELTCSVMLRGYLEEFAGMNIVEFALESDMMIHGGMTQGGGRWGEGGTGELELPQGRVGLVN